MSLKQPGRRQVWLADQGQKVASQGRSRASGAWSQEQARKVEAARRAREACPQLCCSAWGRIFKGQRGMCVHPGGAKVGAGLFGRKGGHPYQRGEGRFP